MAASIWTATKAVFAAIGCGPDAVARGEADGPLWFAMCQPVDGEWRCVEQGLHEGGFAVRLRGDGRGPALRPDTPSS